MSSIFPHRDPFAFAPGTTEQGTIELWIERFIDRLAEFLLAMGADACCFGVVRILVFRFRWGEGGKSKQVSGPAMVVRLGAGAVAADVPYVCSRGSCTAV